jgi:flagellar biosynthesis protein FlgN
MNPPSPLIQTLDNELALMSEFVVLLQQEQRALIDNTLNELIEFAKAKAAKAQSLESSGRVRKRLFAANGVELSEEPPHEVIRITRLPATEFPDVARRWAEILTKARLANTLNHTNGSLIETRQQQNQQLMTMLQHSSTTLSYDAYGLPRLSGRGSSLGKA